jgi:hypothetical protein
VNAEGVATYRREADAGLTALTIERNSALAGETVVLWWGLFDNELYVEHGDRRFGPYLRDGGPIPLNHYRPFKKTTAEKQADGIEELAATLSISKAALSGHPQIAELIPERRIPTAAFVDPDPFQELQYPNAMAAKRAIADYLGMPLGRLSAEQMGQVQTIVNAALDKKKILDQMSQCFHLYDASGGIPGPNEQSGHDRDRGSHNAAHRGGAARHLSLRAGDDGYAEAAGGNGCIEPVNLGHDGHAMHALEAIETGDDLPL